MDIFGSSNIFKINHSPVWSPNMLTLEFIRTKMTTSRGCKSPCVFIEVVLLFTLIFSWDFRSSKYGVEKFCRSTQRNIKIARKIKGKCFVFYFR
jgi:hypothetical protein